MKTVSISKPEMQKRIARFKELKPLPIQESDIPLAARDVVYARKLLSVIGQGPGLHAHRQTYETFTVLKGRFEVTWNDDGSEREVLERFDTVAFPPGVCRAFRNIGAEEGILQVIITGGVHDMTDIDFSEEARQSIEAVGRGLSAEFEKAGFTFTAGK